MRKPARTKRPSKAAIVHQDSLIAPVLGWNTRDPDAGMKKGYATRLENIIPLANEVALRYGTENQLTGLVGAVKSLAIWSSVSGSPSERLFAANDAGIFDATVAGAAGATVSAHTNGLLQSVNFRVSGASYLFVVNGADSLRHYNGTTWTAVATYPINGGGTLTTANISNIHVHQRRLFFIEEASLDFFHLVVDSIGGDAYRFPLGGLFHKGGHLVAMGSWSIDNGAGSDDFAAFVTSKGQVAIYQGIDPTSADDWLLKGVYNLAEPLGLNCLVKFGGDLLYLSKNGLYPLSKALQDLQITDAVSDIIRPTFSDSALSYGSNTGWQVVIDEPNNLLLVNIPTASLSTSEQYVMNITTQAWCKFTGWHAFCWAYFGGALYFGASGKVAKAFVGRDDFDNPIVGIARTAFDYGRFRGRSKKWQLWRLVLRVTGDVGVEMGVDIDFREGTAYNASLSFIDGAVVWGDEDPLAAGDPVWGDEAGSGSEWEDEDDVILPWLTIAAHPGFCAAIRLRLTGETATVSWVATDVKYEDAGGL